jgi:hypothetical protein
MTDPTVPAGAPALPRSIPTSHDRTFLPHPLGLDPKFEKCPPDTEAQESVPWTSEARRTVDCLVAEPVIGRRLAPTRWLLAMTNQGR